MSSTQHIRCPYCLRQLDEQVVAFPPRVAERRLSNFLPLVPSTSESYPAQQRPKRPSLTTDTLAQVPKHQDDAAGAGAVKQRRSSSLSSDTSKNRFRFLRLGPVHWGEQDDVAVDE